MFLTVCEGLYFLLCHTYISTYLFLYLSLTLSLPQEGQVPAVLDDYDLYLYQDDLHHHYLHHLPRLYPLQLCLFTLRLKEKIQHILKFFFSNEGNILRGF